MSLRILLVLFLLSGAASAIANVDNCQALSVAGETYNLTQNVTNSSTCFTVTAANVTLECNGHSIAGANASGTSGVYSNQSNPTIQNCVASNFQYSFYFNGATNGTITNTTTNSTWWSDIYVSSSPNTAIINTSTSGITIQYSNNTQIINTASTNGVSSSYGIYILYSNNLTLSNVNATAPSGIGMTFYGANSTFINVSSIGLDDISFGVVSASECSSTFSNVTGTGNKPILLYANAPASISNLDASAVILCNASNSNLSNVNISSDLYLRYTNNSFFSGINVTSFSSGLIGIFDSANNHFSNLNAIGSGVYSTPIYTYYGFNNTFINVNATTTAINPAFHFYRSNNITVHNLNSISGGSAIELDQSSNVTIINATATSTGNDDELGVYVQECSFITLQNLTASGYSGAVNIYDSEFTTLSYSNLSTTNGRALLVNYLANNNIIENNIITAELSGACAYYTPQCGALYIGSSTNNTVRNNTISTNSDHGIYIGAGAGDSTGNTITNNSITSTSGIGVSMASGASGNFMSNNTISANGTAIDIASTSGNNAFFHNTISAPIWLNNSNSTNQFNTTGMGNIYYFANGTPSWEFFSIYDSDSNNYADAGTDLPFNATTVGGNWSGIGGDYHPYSENGISCMNVSNGNLQLTLKGNVSILSQTCFNISAANVTLDCAGFSITGNNVSSTYGVYSNASNTTLRNCIIANFSTAIFFDGATNGTLSNNTANTTASGGMGIYALNGGNHTINDNHVQAPDYAAMFVEESPDNLIANNTAFSGEGGYGIVVYSNSDRNTILNNTANSTGSDAILVDTVYGNRAINNTAHSGASYAINLAGSQNTNASGNTITCSGGGNGFLSAGTNNSVYQNTIGDLACGGLYITSTGSNYYNNTIYTDLVGFSITGSNNTISDNTVYSESSNSIGARISKAGFNVISGGTFTTSTGVSLIKLGLGAVGAFNNTITSVTLNSSIVHLLIDQYSSNNSLYHNNLTGSGIWVNSSNSTNHFNTTVNGRAQGNYYPNSSSYGAYDFDGDGFSDTNITFNNTLLSSLWPGVGSDYAPAAQLNSPPSATLSISPLSPYPSSSVSCTLSASNPNFPSLNATYSLFLNGAAIQNNSQNITGATQIASLTWAAAGDTIYCSATVSDPYNSTSLNSSTVTVLSPPSQGGSGGGSSSPPAASLPPTEPAPQPPPSTPEQPPAGVPPVPEQLSITVPAKLPSQSPAEAFIHTSSGGPAANFKVTITTPSGKIITTMTDAQGKVQFFTAEPGSYTIEADGTSASTVAIPPPKEPTAQDVAQTVANISDSAANPENASAITYSIAFIAAVIVIAGALAAYLLLVRKK